MFYLLHSQCSKARFPLVAKTKMAPETTFIKACYGRNDAHIPAWLMRQAGRYQQSYREIKEKVGFWGICTDPELIANVTLKAALDLNADAAIIFSDITLPSWAMGMDLEFAPGPRFAQPIRQLNDIDALEIYNPAEKVPFLLQGIKNTRAGLPQEKSLIGFIGAPLTMAAYMVEGKPDRQWRKFKALAYDDPKTLEALLEKLSLALIAHAKAQIAAGCDAIQLFDTSVSEITYTHIHELGFNYAQKVISALKGEGVPVIYFARNVSQHYLHLSKLGADVLGVDWTTSIKEVRNAIGDDITLMGNLDPCMLYCSQSVIKKQVENILEEARGLPGYIFNLGHGVLPETPPENVRFVIDTVHQYDRASA